jgi:hypothetical protein
MEAATIYMYLPDEAVDVWRPVQVEVLGNGHYRVLGPMPEDEKWEYPPGSIIRIEMKRLSTGDAMVAVSGSLN